ncbi:hypothetical protein [Prauserella endophytica]|uniref:Uncharacterized protein n=1 Tax=Prauserella endophytica TaxID=1592324 RepID=A0ABY2RST5_9PSEU|nr:hypothetical protein [Prauserella endophytica]TKG58896.1 hypothetical protein FCN18_37420 [Prauserella endophytica]
MIQDFDYRSLGLVDDDVVMLEWDIAVSKEHLERFIERAHNDPHQVLAAPYLLYNPDGTVWAHRRYTAPGSRRYVREHEPFCHLFGLGMTYLPRRIVREFLASHPGPFSDTSLSVWHYHNAPTTEVPIAWECRPIHLHYDLPEGV